MKPFLKWAGSKYKLMRHLTSLLPQGKRLIEPFTGSGAVFLNTSYDRYLLSDNNIDLINLYKQLQTEGESFITYCSTFFVKNNNVKLRYEKFRQLFNTTQDVKLKSALFIYLNKHCFNGLCRYNSHGKFNVPFGKRSAPIFPFAEMLHFHHKSTTVSFECADFNTTLRKVRKGDIVYCDPPYAPLSKTANFTSYSGNEFTEDDHQALVDWAEKLSRKGITTIISNHDTPFVQRLYRNAHIVQHSVQRSISRDAKSRLRVGEVFAVFGPEVTCSASV